MNESINRDSKSSFCAVAACGAKLFSNARPVAGGELARLYRFGVAAKAIRCAKARASDLIEVPRPVLGR
jgi:hypothetical protein